MTLKKITQIRLIVIIPFHRKVRNYNCCNTTEVYCSCI